ncbi:hypothetical protein J3Q64DRAFT_1849136 [Phycomyces blakesleeanus]|uniref:BTB domain-containing protein n=1 Tax=Phycomyces blakesleeanus TaxID=4837 RepID=A0ABR3B1A3_PHYBL
MSGIMTGLLDVAIEQTTKNLLNGPRSYPQLLALTFHDQDIKNLQDVTIHVFKNEKDEPDEKKSNLNHGSTGSTNENENKKVEDTEGTISNEEATLHGHNFILAAASPWFRDIFLSGMKESTENEVKIHGVDPKIFKLIFDFSYGNDIYIKDSTHGISIIKVADRLQFKRIKVYAFSCLRAQIKNSNMFDIWQASDLYDCDETRKLCEKYMRSNYADIFVSPEWLATSDVYALKAIKIDGLKGIVDETVFYKAVLARREAATQKVIDLQKLKEEESGDEVTKALPGTPTPSNVNIYEKIQKEIKDIKGAKGAKDTKGESKDNDYTTDTQTETETEKLERLENIRWERYIKEELEAIQKHFEVMICHIRFPQMDIEFIADTVEKEDAVMQIPGIKDILFESYRHKAFLGKRELSKKYQSRSIESS